MHCVIADTWLMGDRMPGSRGIPKIISSFIALYVFLRRKEVAGRPSPYPHRSTERLRRLRQPHTSVERTRVSTHYPERMPPRGAQTLAF